MALLVGTPVAPIDRNCRNNYHEVVSMVVSPRYSQRPVYCQLNLHLVVIRAVYVVELDRLPDGVKCSGRATVRNRPAECSCCHRHRKCICITGRRLHCLAERGGDGAAGCHASGPLAGLVELTVGGKVVSTRKGSQNSRCGQSAKVYCRLNPSPSW